MLSSLNYLKAFEAVARLGLVRAAAAELHVTPGAVSQQLRSLEAVVGQSLFRREANRLRLTPAGDELRACAVRVLVDVNACHTTISRGVQRRPKSLTISAPPDLSLLWLSPALFEFAQAAAVDALQTRVAREMMQIDWRSVDVAIVYDTPPWPGFRWHSLGEIALCPTCSPAVARQMRQPPDLLAQCLLHEDDGGEWQRLLNAAGVSGRPKRSAHFQSFTMAVLAALAGHGVVLTSTLLAQEYLRSGRLVQPFSLRVPASRGYYTVCLESRSEEPLVRRFLEFVQTRAGSALAAVGESAAAKRRPPGPVPETA